MTSLRPFPALCRLRLWLHWSLLAAMLGALCGSAGAQQTKALTFAHQDMLVPLRLVMESGELERATGYKIHWRMFAGGGDVIRAMASGAVQMGETGSSPLTAAASQGQGIQLFWISADIANAEALVARKDSGIARMQDLAGKKVATPFVSTAHYQLMAGMKMDGVDPKGVNVMNMRPPEIAAAWERGDIDAAFIWDPVLSRIKEQGRVIASSGSIGQRGAPTFEGIVVNAKWAAANEAFMIAFVKALNRANEEYKAGGKHWAPDSPQIKAMAKWSRADPRDVGPAMARYYFPTLAEQVSPTWLGGGAAKAMAGTAAFLKEQGRVQEVRPDYGAYVTTVYVDKAMRQ
ncbi:taurine ABC transporter substrate-binding protein [Verminephrobacter eiseniae]|nr:taurine ABC transporter substrate-binding protein [Verminephrobacter eiseniae]MCW5303794.1 taurine ABC transporter substrate-binding protein [Verminephrobacter eiseniae]MCW8179240.1 taurine ABC transporter substrate-binding protein [Verminephrobacter eiseniae]MCW8191956.1 taurine ABC transporter substrate-binding protein [Verminephrobacter eiseniae]